MPPRTAPGSATYDAIVIGGGPAGLSAALILGRCRRNILVCDSGQPRNAKSQAMHGFLTRDGIPPGEFLRLAREEVARYGVEVLLRQAVAAEPTHGGFEVTLSDGRKLTCRKLLLATGVVDRLPEVEGAKELYGRSLFHCPYCDGWESRDLPLAVYGADHGSVGLALGLKTWSPDVVLCTGGRRLATVEAARLRENGIPVRREKVLRFQGSDGRLERIVFAAGDPLERRAAFFHSGAHQKSPLAEHLGCDFDRRGSVRTNKLEGTRVPGLYVAGDASDDVQLVVVASAEGAKAGFAINAALQKETLE
ncbi:MAG TPA: NAD(P)/FAD-dependent oxidoreductase [Thermoanaerobaculia bacterium]